MSVHIASLHEQIQFCKLIGRDIVGYYVNLSGSIRRVSLRPLLLQQTTAAAVLQLQILRLTAALTTISHVRGESGLSVV